MRDLSMFLAIAQGLTIAPASWFMIYETLQKFINPEAPPLSCSLNSRNPLSREVSLMPMKKCVFTVQMAYSNKPILSPSGKRVSAI